jgi:hypothetical protein
MTEIVRLGRRAESRHEELQLLDALWGDAVLDEGNPDHAEFVEARHRMNDDLGRIEELARTEILARGIRFPPGGIHHGLLDFPTTVDGRWVFLCWKRGEDRVTHWHEIDGGFAGRQPVTPYLRQRMGRESVDPE